MNNEPTATANSGEEPMSSTAAKRGPGRPKGSGSKQKADKDSAAGAWIYDDTEEQVFVEGAEPADEVVCDGALPPGISIDPDGTRIWNCAEVGGPSAIRRRFRHGSPKNGEKLAKETPAIVEMCESLKARKRCVRWPGAMVVLQYVFKPQTLDTKLSSPRNAKGSLVALRLSPSVSGFISDILHGPLIIDFADAEVSINVFNNALDIAAWMRRELLLAWSDGKIDESEPVRAVVPGLCAYTAMHQTDVPPPAQEPKPSDRPDAKDEHITDELTGLAFVPPQEPTGGYLLAEVALPKGTVVSEEMVGDMIVDALQLPSPLTPPEPPRTRTVADYIKLPISIKANAEAAEMGTGDTLEAILDAVSGKEGCDWPKWRLGATTEELRAVKESGDENLYKTLKRTRLPVWFPSATWTQPRRARANIENVSGTTGLVCLDFDKYESAEAAAKARDEFAIANCEHIMLCALSASGRGFYAIVAANTGGTVETYKTEAVRLMEWVREQGYDPDSGCCDCTRGRILAVDTDAIRMADDWVFTPPVYVMPADAPGKAGRSNVPYSNDPTKKPSKKKVTAYVARAVEKINAAPTGSRNTAFTSACGAASRLCDLYGYDREDADQRLRFAALDSGLDSKEIESVLRRYGPLAGR